jgi:hypothetical protein
MKNIFLICLIIGIFLIGTKAFASTTTSTASSIAPKGLSACNKFYLGTSADETITLLAWGPGQQKNDRVVTAANPLATGFVTLGSASIGAPLLITMPSSVIPDPPLMSWAVDIESSLFTNSIDKGQLGGNILPSSYNIYYFLGLTA